MESHEEQSGNQIATNVISFSFQSLKCLFCQSPAQDIQVYVVILAWKGEDLLC